MCAPTSNIWIDCLERERQNVRPHSVLEPVRPSHLCETNKPTFVDYSSSDSSASKNDNGSDDDEDEKSSNGAEEERTSPPPLNDEVSTLSTSRSPTNSNLQQLLHEAGEENKEKKRQQLGEPKQHNTSIITIHSSDASCSSASTPNKTKKAQQKADQCHSIDCRRPHYKMRGILKRSAKREKIKLAKKEKEYCRGGGKSQDLVAVLGSKLKEIELKECH